MALLNRLDEQAAGAALSAWLAERLPNADDLKLDELEIPQANGLSMTTVLFKASFVQAGERRQLDLVARVAPAQPGLFPEPDLAKEFEVISAVAEHSDVRVPTARWIEPDASVLGSAFIVLDRAYGRCPSDDPPFTAAGWVLDLTPEQRRLMFANGIDELAQIHALDWRALGLSFLEGEQPGIERELEGLRHFYEWAADGKPSTTIDAAFEWVHANAPADDELVLNWGDPRVGNMLFGEDHSVQAVLDWEMVTVASPSMDLAWWLFLQGHHTDGIGLPLPDGIPDRSRTIAIYEQRTGRTVKHIEFYEALAGVRSSIIMVRIGSMMIAAGAIPADNPLPYANPSSMLLAKLLDLPAPQGATADFLGNRD